MKAYLILLIWGLISPAAFSLAPITMDAPTLPSTLSPAGDPQDYTYQLTNHLTRPFPAGNIAVQLNNIPASVAFVKTNQCNDEGITALGTCSFVLEIDPSAVGGSQKIDGTVVVTSPLVRNINTSGINISITSSNFALTTVGFYTNDTSQIVPLSYTTQNGLDWSISASLPPAQNEFDNELLSVSCSNAHCASVGFYFDGSKYIPLSYISADGGVSWQASTTMPAAQNNVDNKLTGVSCVDNQCSAVSYYYSGQDYLPFAYTSSDYGDTWISSTTPPPATSGSLFELFGISCANTNCVSIGQYIPSSNTTPLSYYSTDQGDNWSISTSLPVAPESSTASLKGVSCNETNCVTVGYYQNGCPQPLTYTSHDNGQTWQTAVLPTPVTGRTNMLQSVSCVGDRCSAVGFYSAISGGRKPLTYISTDHGESWTLSNTLPEPIAGSNRTELYSVTCKETACIAVGKYNNGTTFVPISYYSNDNGNTWSAASEPEVLGTNNELLGVN